MRQAFGYIFFALSFAVWAIIAALPFIDISNNEIAGATTLLIIAGELFFLAAIALSGKAAWLKVKAIFKAKN
ncbi:transporter suffix domain-containing protein [Colwellia sp. TT2012]|uniref:transporter suffix domain-containing protein n=1 Tax=Colwellia sp. TT2012 TaxID=1720342 RepID=UPI00070D3C88|nr:transporter suffix domain-containing protein [Colwellia sp. TT2012]